MAKIQTYITRGEIVESTHESKCIIKNYNFKTIFTTHHENDLVYPRSAIKIFQALPFIKSQAYKKYNLTKKQIAISCSSHCGESEHLRVLEEWVTKLDINKKLLQCGIHNPLNKKFSDKLLLSGKKPNQLHNNCAGKHLGMISGCLANMMNTKNYLKPHHEYQKQIKLILEFFTEIKINKIQEAIDGCNAPQYAFPLKNLSISMINLIKNYKEEKIYTKEIKLLLNSIKKFPHLTGSKSIYPSQLMIATNGKMFAKGGAEGVLLFAHKDKKIGGVIKIKDGNERALPSVANEIFKKINILDKSELDKLSKWTNEKILNHQKIVVGKIYTKIK